MITVENKVSAYEVNGAEKFERDALIVSSHWNVPRYVVLTFKGERITVSAKDLHAAINNSTCTAAY